MKNRRWAAIAVSISAAALLLGGCGNEDKGSEEISSGYTFGDGSSTPVSVQPYAPCSNPSGEWTEDQVNTARAIRDVWVGNSLPPRFLSAALLVSFHASNIGTQGGTAIFGEGAETREAAAQAFFDKSRAVRDGAYISYTDLATQASNAPEPVSDPESKVLGLSTFLSNC